MQTRQVRRIALKDLMIALLYGVALTLVLGVPRYQRMDPDMPVLSMSTQTGYTEVDGIMWSRWQTVHGQEILCPPGQSGYTVQDGTRTPSLVCGFPSEETAKGCGGDGPSQTSSLDSGETLRVCETDPAAQEYFSGLGWAAPLRFSGCCPRSQKALCRFTGDSAVLQAAVQCSG